MPQSYVLCVGTLLRILNEFVRDSSERGVHPFGSLRGRWGARRAGAGSSSPESSESSWRRLNDHPSSRERLITLVVHDRAARWDKELNLNRARCELHCARSQTWAWLKRR